MITYKVEPAAKALADANEAFLWIYEEAPDASLRWYNGLIKAFQSLADNPLRCGFAQENPFFDDEIRQLLYGRCRILFTVIGKTVFVLRVRHGAMEHLTPDSGQLHI